MGLEQIKNGAPVDFDSAGTLSYISTEENLRQGKNGVPARCCGAGDIW
jgi:hypothetical protein